MSITCHQCGNTSYNTNDVLLHYCANCHLWHDGPNIVNTEREAETALMTQSIARLIIRTMPHLKFVVATFQDPVGGKIGVDKFGVSLASNMPDDLLLKFLKDTIEEMESGGSQKVTVKG